MPRVDPTEYESLPLAAFRFVEGFALHDVWVVELESASECTLQELRRLMTRDRALFGFRSLLGRLLRLDPPTALTPDPDLAAMLPRRLAEASVVAPGTPEGSFRTVYALPTEAVYQIVNATVHAVLVVALVGEGSTRRLFWATHLKPVGRITSIYMGLIDPFRRWVVYPGLESWLSRAWVSRRV